VCWPIIQALIIIFGHSWLTALERIAFLNCAEKSLRWLQSAAGDAFDDFKPRAALAEVQFDGPAVADHTHGAVNDVLAPGELADGA